MEGLLVCIVAAILVLAALAFAIKVGVSLIFKLIGLCIKAVFALIALPFTVLLRKR